MFNFVSLVLICSYFFCNSFGTDICTRYGVLKQVDSFILAQKENKNIVFDISNLHSITKQIEENYPLFLTNLRNYTPTAIKDENLIRFNNQLNLIKVTGVAKNINKECEKKGATLFTPRTTSDITKIVEIMKTASITSIPLNVHDNRGFLHTLDGTALMAAATEDDSTLKSWSSTYPILTANGFINGVASATVTALCEKTNNPWDLPGPASDRWSELGKLVLRNTPIILDAVAKISESFFTSKNPVTTTVLAAPTSVPYPIPLSLTNILNTLSKWSSAEEWERTKHSDLNTFQSLIKDISNVISLFKARRKSVKFAKKALPSKGISIDSHSLPTQLSLDSDSILLENSVFYPKKFLDTSSDDIPDLVEGSLTLNHADKKDQIKIYELIPFPYGTYMLEPVFIARGPLHTELVQPPAPPLGIECASVSNQKICGHLNKNNDKIRPPSVDTTACINALMGLQTDMVADPKCPLTNQKTKNMIPFGLRIDCSDNFNTVISSKRPLFITPTCNSENGVGFEAKHFPLFLNTDCALTANYLKENEIVLHVPQLESIAEDVGHTLAPLTPFENYVDFGNSSAIDSLLHLPKSGVNMLLTLIGTVFLIASFPFCAILYCCLGPAGFKKFMERRCPCCLTLFNKIMSCCKCCKCCKKCKKCKKSKADKNNRNGRKKKKSSCCKSGCCCDSDSDFESNSAGRTPAGFSRTPARSGNSSPIDDINKMSANIFNLVRNPSAPHDALELTPLNRNTNKMSRAHSINFP